MSAAPRLLVWAGAVIVDELDRLLLVKGSDSRAWDIPGGYLDAGEDPVTGLRRAVTETVGAVVAVQRLIGVHSQVRDGLSLVFGARQIGGVIAAGVGMESVQWVPYASAPRVMWPRRATQLFGASDASRPGGVVITVPVHATTDLGRVAAAATAR